MAKQVKSNRDESSPKMGARDRTDKNQKSGENKQVREPKATQPELEYVDLTNQGEGRDRADRDGVRNDRLSGHQGTALESVGADGAGQNGASTRSTNLRDSAMMSHLLDNLEQGNDIGHFGRLVFVMVARHFMTDEDMLALLLTQPEADETEARALILQVRQRDYNPPRPERIRQWQQQQNFVICPDADDPNGCNIYRDLQFPDNVYENINDFWEEKAENETSE